MLISITLKAPITELDLNKRELQTYKGKNIKILSNI